MLSPHRRKDGEEANSDFSTQRKIERRGLMPANSNLWVLLGLGIAGILIVARKLKRVVKEDFGAFVERFELLPPPQPAPPKAPHPLTGLTFAVADVFNIEGYVTGFGNPDWARTHEVATHTSSLVATLIDGGATCVGKTVIDDMAFSLSGENKYFGTPTNPKSPERIPGGCSSGSAVAVAGGIVDFALGMDTVGGVRVPGAFCGILGFRPSHSILNNGVLHVSPSLDAPGLFAKDPSVLHRAAHVLLKLPYADVRPPRRVIIADDYFQLMKISSRRITQVVTKTVEVLFGKQSLSHANVGEYLASKVSSLKKFQVGAVNGDSKISSLTSLASAMRLLHKYEFRINYENWINSVKPTIAPCVSDNLSAPEENGILINCCQTARSEVQLAIHSLLKDDGILVLPTVSGPPPKLNSKELLSEDYQRRLLNLSAIASMSGCCQITIPLGFHEKLPASVSFIARHGGDRFLLDTVKTIYSNLQDQADIVVKSSSQSISVSKEESAEIAKEKGNNAYKEKQWQKAINLYTEAIKLNGKNATYYSNRAAAYLELGSYMQAEADCSTVINLDKKNVKAFLRRGTAREMLGYYKEAIEDFRYALVLEPTNKTANSAVNRLKKFIP
ncbi:outer envelope protein 64, chloroplastic [Dendrobium catenatum]|uniref:Translocon at the outer membrane of chloroplasts 64 n=1 Tax=Dendrobium catenatum TaxID=906689 RepID=A0A2I0VJB7_9ASPA|nr:outer envelope protein 64, chloroplastic [Dendrobium catenatum]PKU63505.1 Translocon at the outer membrane of chloroplasts 64 [Dendrobium catenatum]